MGTRHERAVDILKWLAMVAVLLHHAMLPPLYDASTTRLVERLQALTDSAALIFFMLSGYLISTRLPPRDYILQRAKRLLIPFVVMSLIGFVQVYLITRLLYPEPIALAALTGRRLFLSLFHLTGFGPQYYFLTYLFVLSSIIYLAVRWIGLPRTLAATLLIMVVHFARGASPYLPKSPLAVNVPLFATMIVAGMVYRRNLQERSWRTPYILLLGTLTALVAAFTLQKNYPIHMMLPFLLHYLLWRLEQSRPLALPAMPDGVGTVFLWHMPMLQPMVHGILNIVGVRNLANLGAGIALTIGICLLLNRVLSRWRYGAWVTLNW